LKRKARKGKSETSAAYRKSILLNLTTVVRIVLLLDRDEKQQPSLTKR